MRKSLIPRTMVGGRSLPRVLIGTNWLLGYSHTGPAADRMITRKHADASSIAEVLCTWQSHGVDALMAPLHAKNELLDAVHMAEDRTQIPMILIDTPVIDVDDSQTARKNARKTIRESRTMGAEFCLIHHASCEQLVDKNKQCIRRLPDYLSMIREEGMIPGLSAHMPEIVLYSDQNEYDVETYIQIYNCFGFMMQVEVEQIARIIHNARKPVMTIKPMAAGRVTPYVGINFSLATLRDCDMITVGAFTSDEAHEDAQIALAAIEGRFPDVVGHRASPAQTQSILGGMG